MKKLALMVYPNFSMQEISSICSLFKWSFDCETVVFSSSLDEVQAEEGIWVKPSKTFDQFVQDEYHCLILSGCSDFSIPIRNEKIKEFLQGFQNNPDFVIGAICAGPVFLAQAGLLHNKKFTCSLFVEMMEWLPFIQEENMLCQPVVTDGTIVTAVGFAFNEFAIAIAKKLGLNCPGKIFTGVTPEKIGNAALYRQHLPSACLAEVKNDFLDLINDATKSITIG